MITRVLDPRNGTSVIDRNAGSESGLYWASLSFDNVVGHSKAMRRDDFSDYSGSSDVEETEELGLEAWMRPVHCFPAWMMKTRTIIAMRAHLNHTLRLVLWRKFGTIGQRL